MAHHYWEFASTFIEFTLEIFITTIAVHRYWDRTIKHSFLEFQDLHIQIRHFPLYIHFFREQEIATTSLFFSTSQEIYFYHSKSLFTIFSSSSCLQLERSPIIHLNWQTWIRLAEYHWSFWDFSKIFQHHHLHLQIDFMCVSFSPSP